MEPLSGKSVGCGGVEWRRTRLMFCEQKQRATMTRQTGDLLPRARCLVCSPHLPPSPRQLPAGLAPAETMLPHYSRNAEPAPRRARPGGSHASALQPERRASSPPGSTRRKPCFCTTAGTTSQLPAGLAPAETMLPHYSRNAEPAPRRARPGGSHASALQPERRASSPPGSPRRKPCFRGTPTVCDNVARGGAQRNPWTNANSQGALKGRDIPADPPCRNWNRRRISRPLGACEHLRPSRGSACFARSTPGYVMAHLWCAAEAMLPYYSRNAEPAPRRACPGGGRIRNVVRKHGSAGASPAGAGSGTTDARSAETWLRRGKARRGAGSGTTDAPSADTWLPAAQGRRGAASVMGTRGEHTRHLARSSSLPV